MPLTNVKSNWVGGNLYFYDAAGSEIFHIDGATRALVVPSGATFTVNGTEVFNADDGVVNALGTDDDIAFVNRATVLNANTTLTGVVVGTPVTPAVAANSFILSNITANGDMLFTVNSGGNSKAWAWMDASAKILRLYSGDGVEVAKFDAAAITLTGTVAITSTLAVTGKTTVTGGLNLGAAEAVTIASGVAAVTKSFVSLAGEGATTDTLDSITKSGQAEGDLLLITCAGNYTITFDNSSTLKLGAGTRAMAQGSKMWLIATSATVWEEVSFVTATS